MKSFTKQTNKWILSTMLMAALGSQYYFSVSSNQIHSIEMSSVAPLEKSETTAQVTLKGCTSGCEEKTFSITNDELKVLSKILKFSGVAEINSEKKEVTKEAAAAKKEPLKESVAKAEVKKEVVAEKETASEKRARLKEEAEQAKQDLQDERNEKFKDAIENLADTCEEKREKLSCMTKGFNRILSQFKKKNKIDAKVVAEAYNDYIAKNLKSLFTSFQTREENIGVLEAAAGGVTENTQKMRLELNKLKVSALSLVDDFTKKVPETYSSLKEDTIKVMASTSIIAAAAINSNFKLADQLAKAKKPESVQVFAQAQIGKTALINNLNIYESSLNSFMQKSENTETSDYFNSTYIPDMKKVLANLTNLTGTPTTATTINQPGQAATNGRDARSGATTTTAPATPAANGVTWQTATTNQTGTRTGVQFSP